MKRFYIGHASHDAALVDEFVGALIVEGCGVARDDVVDREQRTTSIVNPAAEIEAGVEGASVSGDGVVGERRTPLIVDRTAGEITAIVRECAVGQDERLP